MIDTLSRSLVNDKNLRIIFLITLMAVLGVSSITPAIPAIAKELHVAPHSIGLLIIVFTLPGIFLAPVFGVLADHFGRKKILVPSLVIFGIAGFACFFIRDFNILLFFRFFQGCGAAALGALNITLIGDLFTGKKRIEAMGYNASVLSIATASYPFLGGLLASIAWFYSFIPPILAVPVAFIVLWKLDNPEPSQIQNFKSYLTNAFSTLKNRAAIAYFLTSMVVFILLYGSYLTYLPILLNERFNASPLVIGVIFSTMSAVTAVTSFNVAKLSRLISEKWLITFAFLLYFVALLIFPFVKVIWLNCFPIMLFGFGMGILMPSIQTLLTALAPLEYRGAFMSMNGMVLRIGQTLGPLIMGLVFLLAGLKFTFFTGAFIALTTFLALLIFHNKHKV